MSISVPLCLAQKHSACAWRVLKKCENDKYVPKTFDWIYLVILDKVINLSLIAGLTFLLRYPVVSSNLAKCIISFYKVSSSAQFLNVFPLGIMIFHAQNLDLFLFSSSPLPPPYSISHHVYHSHLQSISHLYHFVFWSRPHFLISAVPLQSCNIFISDGNTFLFF